MSIRNKIDLHLHIDGSVRVSTVYELSRKYKFEPECNMTMDEIEKSMVIPDGEFDPDFLTFNPPIRAMQTYEGIERIVFELIEDLHNENVKYAELRFAPQYHLQNGLTQDDAVKAACEGLKRGLEKFNDIKCGIILCCMDIGKASDNRNENIETILIAEKYINQGVCAIDLAGYESDLSSFAELFELAREKNIPATCHSEFTVREALPFKTDRIGHGYQFAENSELIESAIKTGVTLEMCPISSVKYDYGLSIDATHPLRKLFLRGAKVTVNTDNRTVLATCLDLEYECMRKMGFTDSEIENVNKNAINRAFCDNATKQYLLSLTEV